jgi:Na+/melibiose symporter-like transporter
MRDLIPDERLGQFYSKRMRLQTLVGIVLSLLAGWFIDYWKGLLPQEELYAYALLFLIGGIIGIIGVHYISSIPEPEMPSPEKGHGLFGILLSPVKNQNFKNLLVFLGSWNFAVNLASPFFTVYMLKKLNLTMSNVVFLTVLSQIANFTFLRIWGRFTDRYSNKSVLRISGPLFMLSVLAGHSPQCQRGMY